MDSLRVMKINAELMKSFHPHQLISTKETQDIVMLSHRSFITSETADNQKSIAYSELLPKGGDNFDVLHKPLF